MSLILRLYIGEKWPDSDGSGPVKWTVSGKGSPSPNSGVAASLADIPVITNVEVVVPASAVLLTSVQTPGKSLRLFKKTIRFAVEDQIISDPEAVHVAIGPMGPDSVMPVAIADRSWMRKTIELLADNGIYPRAMLVEQLALPIETGSWSVGLSGSSGALRTDVFAGLPLDMEEDGAPPPILEMALNEARKQKTEPSGINIFLMNGSSPLNVKTWEERLGLPITVSGPHNDNGKGSAKNSLNILQGEFAPSMRLAAIVPHLKIPAILLALAVIFHLGSYFVEYWLMKQESQRLTAETEASFRKVFPEIASVTDPEAQMSFKLQQLKAMSGEDKNSGEFLALLEKAVPLLPAGVNLRGVNYGPAGLELKLAFQTDKDSKTFNSALAGLGLEVTAKDGAKEENVFAAEFQIAEKGKKK